MDLQNICFGCFREKTGEVCPYCGYSAAAEQSYIALPAGTILNGRYITGKVLGIGGFGITYLGYDLTLEIKVAIKEYMPSGMATRHADGYNVRLTGRQEAQYRAGESRFLDEARILAKLHNNPNIVSVQNYFRENNTAYFVMEYVDGSSLKGYIEERGGRISYQEAIRYLRPVMSALVEVHSMNLLHRDISPDNIYITRNGESRLLDFGAARFAMGDNKSVSVILKHGYAPEEQYSTHGNQGPWTDVYAMAATFYTAITGVLPPDAIERMNFDRLQPPSSLGVAIPPNAEAALLKALSVKAGDRFSNMASFINALDSAQASAGQYTAPAYNQRTGPVTAPAPDRAAAATGSSGGSAQAPAARSGGKKKLFIIIPIAAIVTVAAIVLIIVLAVNGAKRKNVSYTARQTTSSTRETGYTTATTAPTSAATSPTEESTDTTIATTASSSLFVTRSVTLINAQIQIPDDYEVIDSNGLVYFNADKNRTISMDYVWNMGIPIYDYTDARDNEDVLMEYFFEGESASGYEKTNSADVTVNGLAGYALECEAEADDGTDMLYYIVVLEGKDELGCYMLGACVESSDAEGADEVLEAMDTFTCLGSAGTGWTVYENADLDMMFMYPAEYIKGGIEVVDNTAAQDGVISVFLYPVKGDTSNLVEVDSPVSDTTVDEMMDLIESTYKSANAEMGDRYSVTAGGNDWSAIDMKLTVSGGEINVIAAAAEINGGVYVTALVANDDVYDDALEVLNDIVSSLRPSS